MKCTPEQSLVAAADKFKFFKKDETVAFRVATSDEDTNNAGSKAITVTAATAGEYFCQFYFDAGATNEKESAESASVTLGFGSGKKNKYILCFFNMKMDFLC